MALGPSINQIFRRVFNTGTSPESLNVTVTNPSGGGSSESEIANTDYVADTLAVTDTEALACAGASNLAARKILIIGNPSTNSKIIYFGPTGVDDTIGIPITPGQFQSITVGPNNDVYLICSSGETATAVIQELS